MNLRIITLLVPLIVSAIGNTRIDHYAQAKARPSFTFLPIDPPVISSSSAQSSSSVLEEHDDYFSCGSYGPFSLINPQDCSVNFTYDLYSIGNQTITERIRVFTTSGTVLFGSSKASFSYIRGTTRNVSFNVPLSDLWTNNGLTLKFEILNSSYQILKEYSSSFYPPSNQTISGYTLKREIYTSRSLGFYGDGEKMNPILETFDFTNVGDYINVDRYYRLEIDKNTFSFISNHNILFSSAYLRFDDADNLFPYLTHESNKEVKIPITLNKVADTVRFKFANRFYINKRTLQMSDHYINGYVLTNDFYLPINGRKKFNQKQLYFDLNQIGYDGLTTSIPLKYDVDKSLVGTCTDGDYCIVGGKR